MGRNGSGFGVPLLPGEYTFNTGTFTMSADLTLDGGSVLRDSDWSDLCRDFRDSFQKKGVLTSGSGRDTTAARKVQRTNRVPAASWRSKVSAMSNPPFPACVREGAAWW